jgi:hypothetical protein
MNTGAVPAGSATGGNLSRVTSIDAGPSRPMCHTHLTEQTKERTT